MAYIKMLRVAIFCGALVSMDTFSEKIRIIQGLKNQQTTTIDTDVLEDSGVSLHFLLPTIGKASIFTMLESLRDQLRKQDYLTIVFDAKDTDGIFEKVKEVTGTFVCTTNVLLEEKNLGYWGHGIRNKYKDLPGDFVVHCDDDNKYLPSVIGSVRKVCRDKDTLYLFRRSKIKNGKPAGLSWQKPVIKKYDMDTGSGVIPCRYNRMCMWDYSYGGEISFYTAMAKLVPNEKIFFVDYVTYVYYLHGKSMDLGAPYSDPRCQDQKRAST